MANMVDEKTGEVLTPEQIAAKALEPVAFYVEFSQNVSSDLDIVARYSNKDALIAARKPEVLWEKMAETWRGDAVVELIKAKAKIINDYMDKKERDVAAQHAYIQHLVSTGMSYTDARKKATGK
jgi:hypothetical protein